MASRPSATAAHVPPPGPSAGEGSLRIGAYHVPLDSEALLSWSQLCAIIAQGDLVDLNRHPQCEQEYCEWRAPIKAHFGDLETYIRKVRLQWPDDSAESKAADAYFRSTWGPHRAKCIPNDWPYGIPEGCGHYVVWSKSPILHPSLFETDDTPFEPEQRQSIYEAVAYDGVRGFTGGASEVRIVGLKTMELLKKDAPGVEGEDEAAATAERAHFWAGREVTAYCKQRWPEDQWQT